MTRAELVSEIRRLVRDTSTDSSRQRWSDDELIDRVNDVQEEISALTDMLDSRTSANIVSGTSEYTLPATYIHDIAVQYVDDSGKYIPLTKVTEKELDNRDINWRDQEGSPAEYFIRGNATLVLSPTPNYSRTNGLRYDISIFPTDLTTDSSVPFNADTKWYAYHRSIAFRVASICKMEDGDWVNVDKFQEKYDEMIKMIQRIVQSVSEETRIVNLYEGARHCPRRES